MLTLRHKIKLAAAAVTLIVMSLLRTDADPTMWQLGLVAMMFYETNQQIIIAVWHEVTARRIQGAGRDGEHPLAKWMDYDFRKMEGKR
jgi:hypothetical protein